MFELLNQNLTFSFDFLVVAYITLFSLFFILFVFMLGYIFSKLRAFKADPLDITNESYRKALQILDSAKKQSLRIYQNSQERAKKIIEDAYSFNADTKEELDDHLATITKTQLSDFDRFLKSELKDFESAVSKEAASSIKVFGSLSQDLREEVTESIHDLKENIVKETIESQKMVEDKVEKEYSELEKELEEYKTERMQKIEEKIGDLLCDVSSTVLGVSFSANEHQDVILNVLEEAKKKDLLEF